MGVQEAHCVAFSVSVMIEWLDELCVMSTSTAPYNGIITYSIYVKISSGYDLITPDRNLHSYSYVIV